MAALTAAQSKKLKDQQFAGDGRSYPVPDKSHAVNAKARATQQVKAGNLSAGQKARIDAKANAVIGVKAHTRHTKKSVVKAHKRKLPAALAAHEFHSGK